MIKPYTVIPMNATKNPITEIRLLELQAEYTNHASNEATVRSLGLETGRTREDIAREYGQALREFLDS